MSYTRVHVYFLGFKIYFVLGGGGEGSERAWPALNLRLRVASWSKKVCTADLIHCLMSGLLQMEVETNNKKKIKIEIAISRAW